MKYYIFYISCILYSFNSNAAGATINNQHQHVNNIHTNTIHSGTDGIKLPTPSFFIQEATSDNIIQTHVDSIIKKVDEFCNSIDQEQGIRVQSPSIFIRESVSYFSQLQHRKVQKLQHNDVNGDQIGCNKGFSWNSDSNTCKQQYRQFVKLLPSSTKQPNKK